METIFIRKRWRWLGHVLRRERDRNTHTQPSIEHHKGSESKEDVQKTPGKELRRQS